MIKNLRFKDQKSDKFWRVETAGCELVVNWGKTGTAERYDIKEFDTAEQCEKQAAKLVASKQKKGYVDMPEFDASQHLYFDIDDYGPHPFTSHPLFRTYFSKALYYDCGDEEAPFGSDEGSDTLHVLQEVLRKQPKQKLADFPKMLIEKEWGLTYLPPKAEQTDAELREQASQQYNGLPGERELLQTDQVILATAFGQIKTMGKLDATLQELAFLSLNRLEKMHRLLWGWEKTEPPYFVEIMRSDLTRFVNREE